MENTDPEGGQMTAREMGHKGGSTTMARYGREHFVRIGKMNDGRGGLVTKERYGHEFYVKIGKKGGARVRELVEKGKVLEGEK